MIQDNDILIIENFISIDKEKEIISSIPFMENYKSKQINTMLRYGNYPDDIIHERSVPNYLKDLSIFIFENGITNEIADAIQINEYNKGQGFLPHIDMNCNGDIITIISLKSDTIINFNFINKISFNLRKRSLFQFKGKYRYIKHWINPDDILDKRYSITFRHSLYGIKK